MTSVIRFEAIDPDGLDEGSSGTTVRRHANATQSDSWLLSDADLARLWLAVTRRLVSRETTAYGHLAGMLSGSRDEAVGAQWIGSLSTSTDATG